MSAPRLPARVPAATGEALHSYVARAAAANDAPVTHLWARPPVGHGAKPPAPAVLDRLARLLGDPPAQLLEMTVHRYRPNVTGGKRRDHGWRVDQHNWACPRCSRVTGVIQRNWALALRPACLVCRVLLTPAGVATADLVHVDDSFLLQQRTLENFLERSLHESRYSSYLRRLRHHVLLIARTADADWPRPFSEWERDLRQHAAPEAMRGWTTHPPSSPAVAAALVLPCARAMATGTERELTREAWARLAQPGTTATARELLRASIHLPAGAASESLFAAGQPRSGGRPDWGSLARLHQRMSTLKRQGLRARHVPALCRDDALPLLPSGHELPARHFRAVALVALLLPRSSYSISSLRTAWRYLHLPTIAGSTTLRLMKDCDALSPADADILLAFAEGLLSDGLLDYRERRERLRHVTRVSAAVVGQLPVQAADHPHARTLAAAWLWVHHTSGSTLGFPGTGISHEALLAFDATLNPEGRLVLHEHGEQLVTGTVDLELEVHQGPDLQNERRRSVG